jgi:tetratricopeptide (TPR) repeat protein
MVLGELLYASGRVEEGLSHLREALRLDPLSLDHQVAFGFALRNTRRVNEAILQLQHALVRDPSWHTARLWLAEAYGDAGRHDEAVSEYVKFLRDAALQPERAAMLTEGLLAAYGRSGWRAFWLAELRIAEEEQSAWRDPYVRYCGPYYMARRYARLDDRDRAIESLERAYVDRHHLMVFLDVEPIFDRLRADARFQDLRRRVGLRQR